MGRDVEYALLGKLTEAFQSTRPHGARPFAEALVCAIESFNPRARMGRDIILMPTLPVVRCFNPRARMGRDFPYR